jgi:threonyl-tRNA synthetase
MKEIINITFPDGKSHEERKGITGFEIAEKISKSVAKEAIAFKVNDEIQDLSHCIEKDAQVEIIKKDNVAALEIIRHDCAHIMAEAVQALFPNTQVTIGPAIENGFYYDFAKEEPFTVNDFDKIEKKCWKSSIKERISRVKFGHGTKLLIFFQKEERIIKLN